MEDVIRRSNYVQDARLRRTKFLFRKTPHSVPPTDTPIFHEEFAKVIIHDIEQLEDFAKSHKIGAGVRLNATSDLLWESMPVHARKNIMALFPKVQFYDYTKYPMKERGELPKNYYITFSSSEHPKSDKWAYEWLSSGHNVAIPFAVHHDDPLPLYHTYLGEKLPVIDGDLSDIRFHDPYPCIVGLRAKGFGKQDTSGFVVQVDMNNPPEQEEEFEGGLLFPDFS